MGRRCPQRKQRSPRSWRKKSVKSSRRDKRNTFRFEKNPETVTSALSFRSIVPLQLLFLAIRSVKSTWNDGRREADCWNLKNLRAASKDRCIVRIEFFFFQIQWKRKKEEKNGKIEK